MGEEVLGECECPGRRFVLDHCDNGDPKAFNPKLGAGLKRICTTDARKRGIGTVAAHAPI